jgi:transposase
MPPPLIVGALHPSSDGKPTVLPPRAVGVLHVTLYYEMSVEGVSISAIARIKGISWNTVGRWLERAAAAAGKFNDRMTRGCKLREIQADEIKTFLTSKDSTTWILTTIEVWSRLWPSTVVSARSCRNVKRLVADTSRRGHFTEG